LGEELMMLPTDLALISDPSFKKYVEIYAADRDKFYEDFANVFAKLIELGVDRSEPVSFVLSLECASSAAESSKIDDVSLDENIVRGCSSNVEGSWREEGTRS
jgi:peroxiredoxin